MKMEIRKAKKQDFKEIAEIFRTEFIKKPYKEKWDEKSALKKIEEYSKHHNIYVAVLNSRIVGFIIASTEFWYDGNCGWLENIIVAKRFQGRGVGKALLEKLKKDYEKKKVSSIWLMVNKLSPAYEFYNKLGYRDSKYVILFKES